ncbi:MAG TPA: DUF4129 domain-containing protein [Methylomirabilota bacterium]
MAPLLAWTGLAAAFVLALAAVLRMTAPGSGGPPVSGVIRLPEAVTAVVVSLFGLAVCVFVVDLIRRALSNAKRQGDGEAADEPAPVPAWLRRLGLIMSLVNVIALAYLWRRALLEGGLFAGFGGLTSGLGLPSSDPESAPPIVNWVFGALALAGGLGAFGFALWIAFGDRLTREPEEDAAAAAPPALDAAVEESLEDLRAEPDSRRAIVRCYARFERVAADSGLERKPWLTPMEFMREVLLRLPVPRGAVPSLTGLFELARFSDHALGPRERDRALDALHEIRAVMDARRDDARPG